MSGFFRLGEINFIAGQVVGDGLVVRFIFRIGQIVIFTDIFHPHRIAVEIFVRKQPASSCAQPGSLAKQPASCLNQPESSPRQPCS